MRKLIAIVAIGLVAAACSGDGADTGTETTTTALGDSTTTTSGGNTTTTAPPDTTTSSSQAPQGSTNESCLVGTWILDGDLFMEAIMEAMSEEELEGATFSHVGGEYVVVIQGDGSWVDRRTDWRMGVTSEFGDMEFVINDEQSGTWSAEDGLITVSTSSDTPADTQIFIDGVEIEFPLGLDSMGPPEVEWVSAEYVCDGNTLTITSEGFASVWNRS